MNMAQQTGNLDLWESVFTTDPTYTKQYKGDGGFQGTAVSAMYVVMRATETFGPIGIGWGYTILEESYIEGGPLKVKEGEQPARAVMHSLKIELWYMRDGEKHCVTHYGNTPFVHTNKYGVQTDFEAPKKSLTDAMKKALSMIGFTADIHMGMHDDQNYVEIVSSQLALEKSDDKVDEEARQALEYREWLQENLRLIKTATNLNELRLLHKAVIRKLDMRKDEGSKKAFARAYEDRKVELDAAKVAA
jgi:hypothetical protein